MISLSELDKATDFDQSVRVPERFRKRCAGKYLAPVRYSSKTLFDHMALGKISVFSDYPMKLSKAYNETTQETLIRNLKDGLPKQKKIRIRTGLSHSLRNVTIQDAIDRWLRKRSRFGVTDLHFRGTKFYNQVDAKAISYFNLLCHCPEEVSFLEMLTLVISSEGIFSDSHSDDGDGSNHCFVGKKLWLAWDRREGRSKGLEDCTVDPVFDKAAFDMETFLSLKSSGWFIVSDNHTLFMPGNFTHKVITLEPYIGYGSFYVSVPGYINTLKRWLLYETSDVKGDFVTLLNKTCLRRIAKIARDRTPLRSRWGFPYLQASARRWKQGLSPEEIQFLLKQEDFTNVIRFALNTGLSSH